MMKRMHAHKLLSLLLAVILAFGLVSPAAAAESQENDNLVILSAERVDNDVVDLDGVLYPFGGDNDVAIYSSDEEDENQSENESVRVSIVLDQASTMEAGFDMDNVAFNASAVRYRGTLEQVQSELCAKIEQKVLEGRKMDVVWNLTLAANIISANVPRSAIDQIAQLPGVAAVVEEKRYEPDVVSVGGDYQPHTAVSGQMTGAQASWLKGYTGAGTTVAIIDTGLDTDHQSFDAEAFEHAIHEVEEDRGKTVTLRTAADTAKVLESLNAYKKELQDGSGSLTAEQLYVNKKVPFGYNYVDVNLNITHDNDDQGEHGSHVAGIVAANRYLKQGDSYVDALDTVKVAGAAPDAQLIIMKVFGADGGAYDSDIMAGIEDAILLGADSVNLSLGSAQAGTAKTGNDAYEAIMDKLTETGLVCVISAGNSDSWAAYTSVKNLYYDDVNFDTVGSPGSYTNALTVASVDNDGMISAKMEIDGKSMIFAETLASSGGSAYTNPSITTLDTTSDGSGTAYEYLLIEGVGNEADYTGMDLTDKIVFCKRGDLNFGVKGNNAAKLGAKAVVVYNYEPGLINMDLGDYTEKVPVVFVSNAGAKLTKEKGTEHTTEGGLKYYTGTLKVCGKETANYLDSEYQSISSFSSWGVPGNLSIKPEISAPGGSIYSVNGGVAATDQYELMSGTSMAAPQVAGMAALVQQYLNENNITVAGMTSRALTQSLLMSTAVPMRSEAANGNYFPILQQGAGLANVNAAIQTPVYITVDGVEDGKVKVELGDDPERDGQYTFSFKLNNLSDVARTYTLTGEMFTQDTVMDADLGLKVLSENTKKLSSDFSFRVNGNYVDDNRVVVPANGTVCVNATIYLSSADRIALREDKYPGGAYLEAYVFANTDADANGALVPTLSIPVLGFYGSWTDSTMYDHADYVGEDESIYPYYGTYGANAVGVVYGDKPNYAYYFGGNPVTPDATYHPERNAINLERGDYFYAWKFAPIRNAAAVRVTAENLTTGESLMDPVDAGEVPAAYYYYSVQSWIGADATAEIGLQPEMEPGEHGQLTLSAAPEYYVSEDGTVDWDALGEGAHKTMQFTIDNETPVLDESSVQIDTEKNVLRLTATDDQYLAGAILYDNTGRNIISRVAAPEDAKPGEPVTLEFDLTSVSGYRFVIQVGDYAANFVTYKLKQTIGEPGPRPTSIMFNTVNGKWFTFTKTGYYWSVKTLSAESTIMPYAATAVGSYAYMTGDTGKLYVAPADDLDGLVYVCRLGYVLRDMAYNAKDDRIYGVTEDGLLISFDKMTAATKEHGYIGGEASRIKTLAFDGEKFYCGVPKADEDKYDNNKFCAVYSFTLDTLDTPELVVNASSYYDNYTGEYQSMEYDPVEKKVIWVAGSGYGVDYVEIDPVEKTWTRNTKAYMYNDTNCLICPDWSVEDSWTESQHETKRVVFDRSKVTVQQGYSIQLDVQVLPWSLEKNEQNVTWKSLNPEIATVNDKGVVTGKAVGEATIRVSAAGNATVYADCTVTVEPLNVTVAGALMDDTGKSILYTWDLSGGQNQWQKTLDLDKSITIKCAASIPNTDTFYLLTSSTGVMHKLSMTDGTDLEPSTDSYYKNNYPLFDMAYSNVYSNEETTKVYAIRDSSLVLPFDPMTETNWQARSMGAYVSAIAVGGTEKVEVSDYYGYSTTEYDSEVVYVLDSSCRIHRLNVYEEESYGGTRTSFVGSLIPTDINVAIPTDEVYAGYSSMIVGSDGALYASVFDGSKSTLYRLTYDESISRYVSVNLGSFGDDVWPAALLDVEVRANPDPTPTPDPKPDPTPTPDPELPFVPGNPSTNPNPVEKPKTDENPFRDVSNDDWFYDYVMDMVNQGYMNGISETEFAPNSGLTRAMLVTILYRMDGKQKTAAASSFSDVVEGSYYEEAVAWAAANGIVTGYSETQFAPDDAITRQQMAAILWRYAKYKGISVKANGTTIPDFADRAQIAPWAGEAVSWAYSRGIMTGKSADTLDPNGGATRAEAATMLLRLMKLDHASNLTKE